MRIAVMQPYLFPYVGYFQLLHCVDAFVLLDDVAFIKRGWVNRNRLLLNGEPHLFTIPVISSSQNKLIKDVRLYPDSRVRHKLLATIKQEYHAAPEFEHVFPLVERLVLAPEPDLTALVHHSLVCINEYVGLQTPIVRSSAIDKDCQLLAQDRIIALCRHLKAREYLNMLGGAALYKADKFWQAGIELRFLQPTLAPYQQKAPGFVPGLSVIDVLMYNAASRAKELFQQAVVA